MMGTMPAVLLDANVYRSMSDARFAALLEAERRRGVARYAEPFSVQELLAHLADPQDLAFGSCRRAVVRLYQRDPLHTAPATQDNPTVAVGLDHERLTAARAGGGSARSGRRVLW